MNHSNILIANIHLVFNKYMLNYVDFFVRMIWDG